MQGQAAVDHVSRIAFLHMPIHVGIDQAEDDGLVAHQRLVMAFGIADGLFVVTAVGQFPIQMARFPVFVGEFLETGHWHIVASNDGITMAFLTMSMCEIFHSFNMRSRRQSLFKLTKQNLWLWGSGALALLLTTVVIEVPALAALFEFTTISLREYGIAMGLAILIIPIVEIVKAFQRAAARRKGEELRS